MKITVIGDIHGRTTWKSIVEQNQDSDKIIFLGDYHDIYYNEFRDVDFSVAKRNSINNLFEIIQYKKARPDQVVLLLGNHDSHYIYDLPKCTRIDFENMELLQSIFIKNLSCFQYTWQTGVHLFLHGGVLQRWVEAWYTDLKELGLKNDMTNLGDIINMWGADRSTGTKAVNDIPRLRGGYSPNGGPTWADFDELVPFNSTNIVNGLHQYVGHNRVDAIKKYAKRGVEDTSITFVDVLHNYSDINHLTINI